MCYPHVGRGRLIKSLPLFMVVFLLALTVQLRLNEALPATGITETEEKELRPATVHLPAAANLAEAPVVPSAWQLTDKLPGWANLQQLEVGFSRTCATRFVQNKDAGIYAVSRVRLFLFPAHYYW